MSPGEMCDCAYVVSRLGRCALYFTGISQDMQARLGVPQDQQRAHRCKCMIMVQVFLGAGDAPRSEDHVVFRRRLRDAAGNDDSIYNHIQAYAKDINVTIPPLPELRTWIQHWVQRAMKVL
jgi:hypothetical protein